MIFNQFEEFGNAVWHYHVTGGDRRGGLRADPPARRPPGRLRLGHRLGRHHRRRRLPAHAASRTLKVVATEALQCPTLLRNGFGAHRIEGIGDKHVPWVHNVRNTDMVAAIDDEQCMSLLRLFNEAAGHDVPRARRASSRTSSSSCRWSASPASATWSRRSRPPSTTSWTAATSSSRRSPTRWTSTRSRLQELRERARPLHARAAPRATSPATSRAPAPTTCSELSYRDRKALHNLKYFTWVEQQGKTLEELRPAVGARTSGPRPSPRSRSGTSSIQRVQRAHRRAQALA